MFQQWSDAPERSSWASVLLTSDCFSQASSFRRFGFPPVDQTRSPRKSYRHLSIDRISRACTANVIVANGSDKLFYFIASINYITSVTYLKGMILKVA